jgi:SAM-dependent methyltransferase
VLRVPGARGSQTSQPRKGADGGPPTEVGRLEPHSKKERSTGRRVFGRDPATYDRNRLDYPPRVFEILRQRCHLGASTVALEIGPGTGKATRQLLSEGVASIVAIEANPRLARFLRDRSRRYLSRVEVRAVGFEEAQLPDHQFDLVVAATSFHWLDERRALRKVARALRPGGWWAAWWNHHGDPRHPSPLSRELHRRCGKPDADWPDWVRRGRDRAVLERERRLTLLRRDGRFDRISVEEVRWQVRLSTARARGLWSTFSEVATLPAAKRRRLLDGLADVVDERFGGSLPLRVVTPIYTARRV